MKKIKEFFAYFFQSRKEAENLEPKKDQSSRGETIFWMLLLVAFPLMLVVSLLTYSLVELRNERDTALALVEQYQSTRDVLVDATVAGITNEKLLINYCANKRPGEDICDQYISNLRAIQSSGLYDYEIPEDLPEAQRFQMRAFGIEAGRYFTALIDGWTNRDKAYREWFWQVGSETQAGLGVRLVNIAFPLTDWDLLNTPTPIPIPSDGGSGETAIKVQ